MFQNVWNSWKDWSGDLYGEIKLHTLSPIFISKFIHSWRKWIFNISKGRDFRKQMKTTPGLVLAGWCTVTRLYPGLSKLTSWNKILLSQNVSGKIQCHNG